MLGIVIPVLEEELESLRMNLSRLKNYLHQAQIENYQICVIIQTANQILLEASDNVIYKKVSYHSVSHARNIGLDALALKCEYLYFLDQDALPSLRLLEQTKENMDKKLDVWSGKIFWTSDTCDNCSHEDSKIILLNSFFVPFNTFLGCYFFKSNLVSSHNLRFNENLGPAEDTYLKSGEDILFICEFFSKNKFFHHRSYPNLKVLHPKRPSDNSKTLMYLDGQAAIAKHCVSSQELIIRIRLGWFVYFCLFIINGFKKFIFNEASGLLIFKARVYSLFTRFDIESKEHKK